MPKLILGERIADLGAQNVGSFDVGERLPLFPAIAVQEFNLLGGFPPLVRRPINIGTQPDRLRTLDVGNDLKRKRVPPEVG